MSAPGAGPQASSGDYFRSSSTRTIVLVVGGVVLAGFLGAMAALLLGGPDGGAATSTPAPAGSGALDPAPVGSAAEPTDPGAGPVQPEGDGSAPSAPAQPEPPPLPPGDAITIGDGVRVTVPTGWQLLGSGEDDATLSDGEDNHVYVITGVVDPGTDAGQVLRDTLGTVLPPDRYPDLDASEALPQAPGGSVVSLSMLDYDATWTDGQGTTPVRGSVTAAVRQDGQALVLLGEHTPPDGFDDAWETHLQPVLAGILLPFSGLA